MKAIEQGGVAKRKIYASTRSPSAPIVRGTDACNPLVADNLNVSSSLAPGERQFIAGGFRGNAGSPAS